MQKAKIVLNDANYIIHFDELAKYPDFMLVVSLGDGEAVLSAEESFSHEDNEEIVTQMCNSGQKPGRIRYISFNKAMALLGFGLPCKNYPILEKLLELKFLTKEV